jgi:hypothetical protein
MAVMLTSVTTIAGFACMIVSRHQGLRSLGQILTFGMTTCMVVSLFGLYALLRWRTAGRPDLPEEADDVLPASSDETALVMELTLPADVEPVLELTRPRIRPTRSRPTRISLLSDDRAA